MGDLGSIPSWAIIIFAFIFFDLSSPPLWHKTASTSNSGLVDKQIFYDLVGFAVFGCVYSLVPTRLCILGALIRVVEK